MKLKQSLIAAGALAAIGAGLVFANPVQAESSGTSMVDKLVARFNLNKDEVQAFFNEEKAAHHEEMKAKMEERLQKAVDEGKITAEQRDKIVAKLEELKANHPTKEEMEGKTAQERKALMEQHRAEIEAWAEENDIPLEYLKVFKHGKGGPGHGHGMRMHLNN